MANAYERSAFGSLACLHQPDAEIRHLTATLHQACRHQQSRSASVGADGDLKCFSQCGMRASAERRRRHAPICFSVLPRALTTREAETTEGRRLQGRSDRLDTLQALADALRQQMAEKEDEAQQNWAALLDTRNALSGLRFDLEAASVREQHLRSRLRRLRNGYREQRQTLRAADSAAVAALKRQAAEAERRTVEALTRGAGVQAELRITKARTVRAVLGLAREHLAALSIPSQVADKASSLLDESGHRQSRARAVGAALSALHAYAIDGSRNRDFRQWCASGGHGVSISASSVAMTESKSVQRNTTQAAARVFPVDPLLHDSGERQMFTHIKLDQGPTASRLHFHDDTRGHTGKIHIGYIGPHLPTTHDPT